MLGQTQKKSSTSNWICRLGRQEKEKRQKRSSQHNKVWHLCKNALIENKPVGGGKSKVDLLFPMTSKCFLLVPNNQEPRHLSGRVQTNFLTISSCQREFESPPTSERSSLVALSECIWSPAFSFLRGEAVLGLYKVMNRFLSYKIHAQWAVEQVWVAL